MNAAVEPRAHREMTRLLIIDRIQGAFRDSDAASLPAVLDRGDLIILNDAATLPAALPARGPSGTRVEIRLMSHVGGANWKAVLMGPGHWTTPTELRAAPEIIRPGDSLDIADSFFARILELESDSGRIATLRFSREGAAMWAGIYAYGRPVQYSHMKEDLSLWSVQTAYASRPWAVEMPSAGYSLNWRTLLELRRRGVQIARLTHAAGLSSIGDSHLDARLPFPERFEIPQPTIDGIHEARRRRGRVIAVGTTVVRALEGSFELHKRLTAGEGTTNLVIDESFSPKVVDGILTGMHNPDQSHFRLLRAFIDGDCLEAAWRHANQAGYLSHEFGDVCLIL